MGQQASTVEQVTPGERKLIEELWAQIMQTPEACGELILKTYFDKYSAYTDKFVKFRGIPAAELYETPVFKRHAMSIIEAFDSVIQSLDNHEEMCSKLVRLGRNHGKKNLSRQQFDELKSTILEIFRDVLKTSEECISAFAKVIDIAYKYIYQGLDEEEARK